MDWKKSLDAAAIPILALVVLYILNAEFTHQNSSSTIFLLLSMLITLWVGYRAVKEFSLNLPSATLAGLFAGAAANFLNWITWLIEMNEYWRAESSVGVRVGLLLQIIYVVVGLIAQVMFGMGIGVVFGALGFFIAQNKLKQVLAGVKAEWEKSLEAAKIPIIAWVMFYILIISGPRYVVHVYGDVLYGYRIIATLGDAYSFIAILVSIMSLFGVFIYLWAGHRAVKKFKLDWVGSALTGLFIGAAAGLVNGIIAEIIDVNLLVGQVPAEVGRSYLDLYLAQDIYSGMLRVVLGVIGGIIAGAAYAAFGGFLAQKKPK